MSTPGRSVPRVDIFYPLSNGDSRRDVIAHECAHIAYRDLHWHKVYSELEAIKIMATIEPELVAAYSGYIDLGEECIVRLADHQRAGADLPDMSAGLRRIVRQLSRPKTGRLMMCAAAALLALVVVVVPVVASAAGAKVVVRLESPSGALWRSWACPVDGGPPEWASVGPQVDEWRALMTQHGYGYQPGLPKCPAVLAACAGGAGEVVERYGPDRQPPGTAPNGPWAVQKWDSVVRITCP
ncbi:hypothetical protein [Rhodobacter sp. 24-YEA-8]|uniref:hypothetical protein n=1 Tax=Rhodobacter sp. 24-YEA-8 TaxID=1884310 RepID=UPI00116002D9|nr:hypothetical protein [Rhodobacter sp. 24-YEA-8]